MPQVTALSTPLAYALAYASLGWKVFPLEPRAKVPMGRLASRGMLDATTDQDMIRAWWRAAPEAGIGIALAASGLAAIDIDPRNGGTETFDDLQAAHGSLRSDVCAYTGGGGEHHVFVLPDGAHISLPGTLGPGVDLKCNGYIVVEPSIHPNGKAYVWEASSSPLDGVVPSPLPDWLRNMRSAPAASVRDATGRVSEGGRNNHLSRKAMALRQLGMEVVEVQDALARINTRECNPPLLAEEVQAIAEGKAGIAPDPIIRIGGTASQPNTELILSLDQLRKANGAIRWAVKHILPADSIGVLFGGSGTFKSFLSLDLALHTAHGLPWLGRKTKRAQVIYIAAEGGAGLWKRIEAWHKARGLSPDGIPMHVVIMPVDLSRSAREVYEAAMTIGITPGLVIVDTMSQTFPGEENSANEVAGYFRELGTYFRAAWAAAVLIVHHSGHMATERPRGSSAIRSNVDFMFGVFRDEKQMIARMECHKQKDGETFSEVSFGLDSVKLGFDEDGDAVTSLYAKHIESEEELENRKQAEAGKPRSFGKHADTALKLAQIGMSEKAWRMAFYAVTPGTADDQGKSWRRSVNTLIAAKAVELTFDPGSRTNILTAVGRTSSESEIGQISVLVGQTGPKCPNRTIGQIHI